jgi:hypothetical protein
MKQLLASLFIAAPLLFTACKKQAGDETNPTAELLRTKVTTWLEKQKTTAPTNKAALLQSLSENLDWQKMTVEKYKNSGNLVVLPVLDAFKTNRHAEPGSLVYLLLQTEANDISKASLCIFKPAPGQLVTDLPANTFSQLFNEEDIAVSGKFKMLTVTGNLRYEVTTKDGKFNSFGYLKPGNEANGASHTATEGCTDWYIVTTIYVNGTPVSQTSEYVGTTCDNSCNDPDLASLCPGDGGGGSGTDIIFEYSLTHHTNWKVMDIPTNPNDSYGAVRSTETIKGKKNSLHPQNGYFTNIHHDYSICVVCSVDNNPYNNWIEENYSVGLNTSQEAYCRVKGHLNWIGRTYRDEKQEKFQFNVVFP